MEAPGKGILKVVSILFIIFGAMATVISLVILLARQRCSHRLAGSSALWAVS
jgi:hypothetical protein